MELIMIHSNRLPTKRAHGLQMVKMCEAFADNGVKVKLVIPHIPDEEIKDDIFHYYGVKKNFSVNTKQCLNFKNKHKIRFLTFLISLALSAITGKKDSLIFTRYPEIAFLYSLLGYQVIFEIHNWYEKERKAKKNLFLLKKVFLIIVTTKIIKKEFIKNGFKEDIIMVASHGVDIERFNLNIEKDAARAKLGWPLNKKIVLYSGGLQKSKGVFTILKASKYLSDEYLIIFIGGMEGDIDALKKADPGYKNVKILGFKKYAEIPLYLKSADFLALANSEKSFIESNYTSPLKLFEYLAAGRAVIASDVPAIREFVDETKAVFFKSDDARNLAQAIKSINSNKNRQNFLINNSWQLVKNFTWQRRSENILKFINEKTKTS